MNTVYNKTCLKWPLSKRPQIGLQSKLSLNAGQKDCRMLPLEHSAILSTFIKLPFVIKSLFCLFLSGRFTQVLLYCKEYFFMLRFLFYFFSLQQLDKKQKSYLRVNRTPNVNTRKFT